MTLLNPIWLWALGGLTIPVAIHLLSRKEGKTIRMGSIRFLTETATSKFSSIRVNEVVLLAIRSLLIVLVVLFLASLFLSTPNKNVSQKWVVVERGLEKDAQIKNLLDSLQKNNYEIRKLAVGFPLPEDDTVTQPPDYYKLSEQLSQQKNILAIVIASNKLSNFKGKRISVPENITWLPYPASATQHVSTDSITVSDTLNVTLAYDPTFQYDRKIVRAALHVLQAAGHLKINLKEIETQNLTTPNGWIIWLSNDEFNYPGKLLRVKEDKSEDLIVQSNKNEWTLTKRLNEENAVREHLAVELMNILSNEKIKHEIRKTDNRIVQDELAWSGGATTQSTDVLQAGQSIDKILILLIAVVFIAERILAFYRKQ